MDSDDFLKIGLCSDHAGFALKDHLIASLSSYPYHLQDFGTNQGAEVKVDYPVYALRLAGAVSSGNLDKGIAICGSGVGVSIACNKVDGIRAGVAWNIEVAKLTRAHNDVNILCLPARFLDHAEAFKIVQVWLYTEFEGGRHLNRIKQLTDFEKNRGKNETLGNSV